MICALLTANRKATFRFFGLPVELRYLVYEDLLTFRPIKWHSESKTCHPAILATCKQVHEEANGFLNDEREAEICITLRHRELRVSTGGSGRRQKRYGVDVEFKGAVIFSTTIPTYCRQWVGR